VLALVESNLNKTHEFNFPFGLYYAKDVINITGEKLESILLLVTKILM